MEVWMVWIARLMYVALFPIGIGMLYRAARIGRGDWRHVAAWRGRTLPEPGRWAAWVRGIHLAGGASLLTIALAVLAIGLPFTLWTGAAALTLWTYYFAMRVVVQRAERGQGPR